MIVRYSMRLIFLVFVTRLLTLAQSAPRPTTEPTQATSDETLSRILSNDWPRMGWPPSDATVKLENRMSSKDTDSIRQIKIFGSA